MSQLGYYGKTPHRGDFVRFNLPQSFINVWDDWLQQVLIEGEQQHQDWSTIYQQAPSYRFTFSSGIAGNEVWIGVLSPSQDKVGRRFPFCLAMSLDEYALPCVNASAQTAFFEEAESLLIRVLGSEYDFDQLQGELTQMREKYEAAMTASARMGEGPAGITEKAISVNIDSSIALTSAQGTGAMLDILLKQTLNEYSLWITCAPAAKTILHAGLPTGEAAQSLFSSNWKSDASRDIQLDSLLTATGSIMPALAKQGRLAGNQSPGENASTDQTNPSADVADETQQAATGVSMSAESEQTPTADDWAALEDFDEDSTPLETAMVPDVEPLELDEDVQDAPWEN